MRVLVKMSLLVALVVSSLSDNASAILCTPPVADVSSGYDLLNSYADAMVYIDEARSGPIDAAAKKNADIESIMLSLKKAGDSYDCAISHFQPFQSSRNDVIAEAAKGFVSSIQYMKDHGSRIYEKIKKGLDGLDEKRAASAKAEDNVQEQLGLNSALELFALSAASATHAAVDPKTTVAKPILAMTVAQRKDLVKKLEKVGSKRTKTKIKTYFDLATTSVLKFLKDKAWNTRTPAS